MTPAEVMLAAARRLAALGLAVHWLRAPKAGGKAPISKEWQRAPWTPPEQVDGGYKLGCNLGIHTGLVEGAPLPVVVVDLDSPEALAWAREHLPPTPWRTLTSKGEHWFFRHPGEGAKVPNKAKIGGVALDIRGDGGNVVVAPSLHPSGAVYAEAESWDTAAPLPVFAPSWFAHPEPPKVERATRRRGPMHDHDLLLKRARGYLAGMPPAISGQGGHDQTLWAAAALTRGFCLPSAAAMSLLQSDYNPRCDPPWSERELQHKVDESLKLSRLPPDGWLRDAESPRFQAQGAESPPWWAAVPDAVRERDAPPVRPAIHVSSRLDEMRDQAIVALAAGAPIFHRGGRLVDLIDSPPRIRDVPPHHLRTLLSSAAEWLRYDGRTQAWAPVAPPLDLARAVLDAGTWPGLRELRGVVEAPTLRQDGSILSSPGYDESTRLYLTQDLDLDIPPHPTREDAAQALGLLMEAVCDFPFAHEAGPSAWLAGLLTMLARYAIDGPVPLFLVDANTRGTGKTLLADVAHWIAFGRELEKTPQGKDSEEDGKVLLGLALAGVPVVLWDNIAKPFGSAALDAALTAGVLRARVLGKNDMPCVFLMVCWWATGNNVRFRGDLVRRSIRIRLLSPEERPETRQGFRHPHLIPWVLQERPRLLRAALTILRAYCVAGRPACGMAPLGRYEEWSALIRGTLLWLDQPDPVLCNDADHQDADDEAAALPDLIEGWAELCSQIPGQDWCTTAEAVRRLQDRRDGRWVFPLQRLRDALSELCGPEVPSAMALGHKLKRYRDRTVNGRAITPARDTGARGWRVITIPH